MAITEVIPNFSAPEPNRLQSPEDFADSADLMVSEFNAVITSQNTLAGQINSESTTMNGYATAASASATSAANSATGAANSANFKGAWSTLTGAINKPAQVLHNGAYWQLLNNLADVTASQPSPTNTDWAFASGTRWAKYTASATLAANSQNTIVATSGAADMALPTMAVNDFIVLHNAKNSTQVVRLMNSTYTIRGRRGTASAGDNLIMGAGDTIHVVCVATNELGAV
jgi:hypothetical protein